jgi:hypothetical protein
MPELSFWRPAVPVIVQPSHWGWSAYDENAVPDGAEAALIFSGDDLLDVVKSIRNLDPLAPIRILPNPEYFLEEDTS